MRIDSSGNVGINTTSPETKLHVKGTSNLLAPIVVEGTSTNGFNLISDRAFNGESFTNLGVQWSGGGMVLGSFVKPSNTSNSDATGYLSSYDGGSVKRSAIVVDGAAGNIKFLNTDTSATVAVDTAVAMSERLRINSTGNVGIGTTAPDAKLSVNGVASFGDGTAAAPSIANFGDLDTGMFFPAADTIAFSEGGVEAMRINSSGNVLIGTTSAGTFSGQAVVAIGDSIGIINNKNLSVATSGTLDISINTTGGAYQGFLCVSNTDIANGGVRTQTTFSVFGRGTDSSIQQISTDNGAGGGRTFTVTTPTNGVIRVTNTSATTCAVVMQFFGGTSF